MSIVTIPHRYGVRGGTAANLALVNEVPLIRELVYETDTGRAKLGDAVTNYNDLPYISPGHFDLTGIADGDTLAWDATAQVWKVSPPGGGAEGGILVQGGSTDLTAALPVNFVVSGISAAAYDLTDWELWCLPSGSIELDVRVCPFAALPPDSGDSIVAAAPPEVVAGISASGAATGWTTAIARSDAISVVVVANSGVKWFSLLLKGTRAS